MQPLPRTGRGNEDPAQPSREPAVWARGQGGHEAPEPVRVAALAVPGSLVAGAFLAVVSLSFLALCVRVFSPAYPFLSRSLVVSPAEDIRKNGRGTGAEVHP